MQPAFAIVVFLWLSLLTAMGIAWRRYAHRSIATARLAEVVQAAEEEATSRERSWLGWWLYRAGFRQPQAVTMFLGATLVGLVVGGTATYLVMAAGLNDLLSELLLRVPGAVGEVFLPIAWLLPWAAGAFLVALPALIVQSVRKRRVTAVEQDLPILLDLLSALAEAGLGFDAALDRILEAEPPQRPLVQEFRLLQTDVLAGRGRVKALRQLGRRVDVPWFSILIAALIHADQVGSGLSETLKIQAEDLRQRRRERALAFAMSLPIRLLPALVICFLPGLMVAAVAPVAYQIVQVLDQFIRQPFGN